MNKALEDSIQYYSNSELYDIQDWHDGNFVVVTILRKSDAEIVSVGVAKRNPNCDENNPERGRYCHSACGEMHGHMGEIRLG